MVRIFHHYLPRSLTLLALVEFFILFLSVYVGMQLYIANTESEIINWSAPLFPRAFLFAGIVFSAMLLAGLYWHYQQRSFFEVLARVVMGFVLGVALIIGGCYALSIPILPSDACFDAFQISFVGVLLVHVAHHFLSRSNTLKQRVLVLGADTSARQLALATGTDIDFVAYPPVTDQEENEVQLGSPYARNLLELVRESDIEEIVVALGDVRKAGCIDTLLKCKLDGIRITDVSDFVERRFGKIDLSRLRQNRIIFSEGFRVSSLQGFVKRMFDVIISMLLLLLTWPVMLFAALAILVESRGRGPIFYRQERVGRGGCLFDVIKFRSMRTDAEKSGAPQYAQQDDPRVTKVGRILRNLRIDELPQILNVLRGEMSFVGPRPERPEFVRQYVDRIPYYDIRHAVKPGITGWAQISYPYGSGEQDAREKLQYDLYYLKNYSFLLDMNIIFQTAHVVLLENGAR